MSDALVLYSPGNNDEVMTPDYAVQPIVKHLRHGARVWCPFDTEQSAFVLVLRGAGVDVVHSHISTGQDFYRYEPDRWDVIVSNPPFTRKRQIFERALGFNKPFALLMTLTWLNDAAPKELFGSRLQLLMFNQRVQFTNAGKVTFASAYYCRDFLAQQIIVDQLPEREAA